MRPLSRFKASMILQAADEFEKIARARPDDEEVPKVLAQLWHTLGHPDRGIQALEDFLQRKASHPTILPFISAFLLLPAYMEQP